MRKFDLAKIIEHGISGGVDEPPKKTDVEQFLDDIEKGDITQSTEPEVIEEPAKPASTVVETPPLPEVTPAPVVVDPLTQALKTIEDLKADVDRLKTTRPTEAAPPARVEPEVETVEVLGYRVPKASEKRAVRVTAQDLVNLGWNENPAAAIETLANVFVAHIRNILVEPAIQGARSQDVQATAIERQRSWFDNEHKDLKEEKDLLRTVEAGIMQEPDWQRRTQAEHLREVAKRARTTIARWRGQTHDQYVADLGKGTSTSTPTPTPSSTRGRAVTATSGGRAPIETPSIDQKELSDVAIDAVRR